MQYTYQKQQAVNPYEMTAAEISAAIGVEGIRIVQRNTRGRGTFTIDAPRALNEAQQAALDALMANGDAVLVS